MLWASIRSSSFKSFAARDWSARVKKIKSKGSPSASKNTHQSFLITGVPQITLLFLFHICIFVYIEHLLIWEFSTELVNSTSTLRKVGTQQVIEGGPLWSYKNNKLMWWSCKTTQCKGSLWSWKNNKFMWWTYKTIWCKCSLWSSK